jgi:small subunit ribosomal protein S5
MARGSRGRKGGRPQRRKRDPTPVEWTPKTKLGRMVKSGEITTMSDALRKGLPIREPEIADLLLPGLEDEVIDVNMVQRMTDSGRRIKFVITVAVGNNDGYVGIGQAKGKEVGSSIRKAIENAKTNIIEIKRGCGSWECGCGQPHTVPCAVSGKSGSVEITFKPAPRGIGLATGDVAKKILTLAGVKDCWTFTRGKTKTTVNYAKAVFNALETNANMHIMSKQVAKVGIKSGSIKPPAPVEQQPVVEVEKQPAEKVKEGQVAPVKEPPKEGKKSEPAAESKEEKINEEQSKATEEVAK